jgi:hypothetical protein
MLIESHVGNFRLGLTGSALDLRLSDINIASLDKDLEEQDSRDPGITGEDAELQLLLKLHPC